MAAALMAALHVGAALLAVTARVLGREDVA